MIIMDTIIPMDMGIIRVDMVVVDIRIEVVVKLENHKTVRIIANSY